MIEHPTKMFPCDCFSEGLVVVRQDDICDDCAGSPYIEIGFWNYGHVTRKRDWRWRLKTCWQILRRGTCWTDMVILKKKTARNFANHILYLLSKKSKVNEKNCLVKSLEERKGTISFAPILYESKPDEMIKEKEKELTISELNKVTWDYSEVAIIGLFNDKIVKRFLFEVKECGNINPLVIQKCNVAEGWIEYLKCEGEPIKALGRIILLPGRPEIDEDGNIKRGRLNCNVVVDVLDSQGKVITTLGKND